MLAVRLFRAQLICLRAAHHATNGKKMPELPEVETVRRGLVPCLEGRTLARVEVRRPDLRRPLPPDLVQVLTGSRITALRRRSKYILADLEDRGSLLIHLGMSGRILIEGAASADYHRDPAILPRHDHVVLETSEGTRITYNDARRFGMIDLIAPGAEPAAFAGLGPEPLSDEFTGAVLARALSGRATPIKLALLDQRIVAGLGNIYVSESLHRAGIDPRRAAGRIARARIDALTGHIRDVLAEAIAAGGSSLRDHRQATGELGYFQHSFRVYDREGAPCPTPGCTGTIRRITQAGRSSYFCPACQH